MFIAGVSDIAVGSTGPVGVSVEIVILESFLSRPESEISKEAAETIVMFTKVPAETFRKISRTSCPL